MPDNTIYPFFNKSIYSMNACCYELMNRRRSIYQLGEQSSLSREKIILMLEHAILTAPCAFNIQTTRVYLLFDKAYHDLWDITLGELAKVTPPNDFLKTKNKINSFKQGLGTLLFFEDNNVIQKMKKNYPLYQNKFNEWSIQNNAICQYNVWLMLTSLGLGANLQHYNPLIDKHVYDRYDIPYHLKLNAQMNFGTILKQPEPKSYPHINEIVNIL